MINSLSQTAWHALTRNRRTLERRQAEVLGRLNVDRVLEVGSGQSRRGRDFQSAAHLAGPDVTFVMTDVDPRRGHRILDITRPDIGIGQFPLVLCCNVLEHIFDIGAAVDGVAALCENDGTVFVSTPFVYPYHDEPSDYWRPTAYSLGSLFAQRFTDVEITWSGTRRFPFQIFVEARRPLR